MGKLEERNKKKLRRENLQRIILQSVATAGILSVGLVAPNVIGAMNKLGLLPKIREKEYVSSSAVKLVRRGLLEFKGRYYQLTKEGEKVLRKWELADYSLRKPKKWDGKWRMIIFDIPEKKRKVRKQISTLFNQAGLHRLQDSVWVYPYDCEDIIGLLKTDFGIGKDLLYVIANEIENDKHLRSEFGLLNS
ncbi:MAG: Transcriptional regulator, PaaX family [Parcubacteria group bacterium GW2011_GWD1_44_9]|nr:MAG: Transcriptional regulator, PaaX family [Parcubacteria group bacterium GW2011_GWD1_44_9]